MLAIVSLLVIVTPGTRIEPKDRIIAYGRSSRPAEIDCRCAGTRGDELHDQACRPAAEATDASTAGGGSS